jgi:hypothetical protein
MDWTCTSDAETRNKYKVLIGKPLWKKPHGMLKIRLEDVVKLILRKCIVGIAGRWNMLRVIWYSYYEKHC